jgi:hypothetical protein
MHAIGDNESMKYTFATSCCCPLGRGSAMYLHVVCLELHPRLLGLLLSMLLSSAGARNLRQASPAPVCSATAVSSAQASGGGTSVSQAQAQVS